MGSTAAHIWTPYKITDVTTDASSLRVPVVGTLLFAISNVIAAVVVSAFFVTTDMCVVKFRRWSNQILQYLNNADGKSSGAHLAPALLFGMHLSTVKRLSCI